MEELFDYVNKIQTSEKLIKTCKLHLLSLDDFKVFKFKSIVDWRLLLKISIEYDMVYDRLYIGSYNEVHDDLKEMFLILSFLKAYGILKTKQKELEQLIEAIRILDVGIMIGCGLKENAELITEFTQKLHDYTVTFYGIDLLDPKCFNMTHSSKNECEVDCVQKPSIEHFWTKYLHLHQPVKILDSINHWNALDKWKNINYFIQTAGFRTVPVELGKTYDDDRWGQSLYKFKDFLATFVANKTSQTTGYLAQHDLFDQIPVLKDDFFIPDYCAISSNNPIIKSWIGPENTISTMHTDDKHNLLCQVVGEKLVILATPHESKNLYQYEGILHNTSQVDAENPDFEQFPLVKNVKFLRIILKAGEILYIPKMWWHYCRSLTKSISVSFWFDIDNE